MRRQDTEAAQQARCSAYVYILSLYIYRGTRQRCLDDTTYAAYMREQTRMDRLRRLQPLRPLSVQRCFIASHAERRDAGARAV